MILFTDKIVQLSGFENLEAMLQEKEAQKIMQQVYKRIGQPLLIPEFEHDDVEKN